MSTNTGGKNWGSISRDRGAAALPGPQARKLLLWASAITLALCFVPNPYYDIILWPIRLFVTMIHESGHAIASVVVGGYVKFVQISPNGEGLTMSAAPPWARWIVLSGGYLGATLFGAFLLQVVRYTGHKATLTIIGIYLALATLLWSNNPVDNLFTLVTGLTLAALFFVAAYKLSPQAAGFLVAFLAVQCCMNAIGDLRILLYLTDNMPGKDNDALFMSQQYGLTPSFWAAIWAGIALTILALSLWRYLRATGAGGSRKRAA